MLIKGSLTALNSVAGKVLQHCIRNHNKYCGTRAHYKVAFSCVVNYRHCHT